MLDKLDLSGLIDKLITLLPADMQAKAKSSRKAIVGMIGALLSALTMLQRFNFLIPAQYQKQVATAISILTAISTYMTPNEPNV